MNIYFFNYPHYSQITFQNCASLLLWWCILVLWAYISVRTAKSQPFEYTKSIFRKRCHLQRGKNANVLRFTTFENIYKIYEFTSEQYYLKCTDFTCCHESILYISHHCIHNDFFFASIPS